jgi:LysR family glycine cleavage system transcriptional activator
VIPLVHDEVIPVCSPEFWHTHGNQEFDLAQIQQNLFIHTNWGVNYASLPTWSDWFSQISSNHYPDLTQGRRCGFSGLSISLARLGLGIALGQKLMTQGDLESGKLIALSSVSLRVGHPYCAFVPIAKTGRADIKRILALLRE